MNRRFVSMLAAVVASGGALLAGVTVAGAVAPPEPVPADAQAAPAAAPVAPAAPVTSTTLPLFGAPLTIDITAGPGGVLARVAVNPADGFTAVEVKPNEVEFVNDAGTATIEVKARHGGQRIEVHAASLDDLVAGGGAGGWSGDVFGDGVVTDVGFTVVKNADGSPDITGIAVSGATAVVGEVEHSDGGARVSIRFTNGEQSRVLSIRVSTPDGDDHEDDDGAGIRIDLSRLKGLDLPAAEAAGTRTWNGTLCNGDPASITYTVGEDGSLSDVGSQPPAARNRLDGHSSADVRFSDIERVRIRVTSHDGRVRVSVDEKFRCDSPDPAVNTDVSTTLADDESDDESDDEADDESGDESGGRSGDHEDGDGSGKERGSDEGQARVGGGDRSGPGDD